QLASDHLPRPHPGRSELHVWRRLHRDCECKGVQSAVLHYAEVFEPGARWVILDEVQQPIRNVKPRLKKCTGDEGDWLVLVTPEPVANAREIQEWLGGLQKQWREKGYEIDTRSEKPIFLN
ncbi:MAG: hypothetical protein AAFV53_08565, partial [Myxococcota bacterium]